MVRVRPKPVMRPFVFDWQLVRVSAEQPEFDLSCTRVAPGTHHQDTFRIFSREIFLGTFGHLSNAIPMIATHMQMYTMLVKNKVITQPPLVKPEIF